MLVVATTFWAHLFNKWQWGTYVSPVTSILNSIVSVLLNLLCTIAAHDSHLTSHWSLSSLHWFIQMLFPSSYSDNGKCLICCCPQTGNHWIHSMLSLQPITALMWGSKYLIIQIKHVSFPRNQASASTEEQLSAKSWFSTIETRAGRGGPQSTIVHKRTIEIWS